MEHINYKEYEPLLLVLEQQPWVKIERPDYHEIITQETHRRMLKGFATCWDYRFGGFYEQDWMYIYRSGHLLVRFKMIPNGEQWQMSDLQAIEPRGYKNILNEYFNVIKHRWYFLSDEKAPKNLRVCKYYRGLDEIPVQFKGRDEEKFWHGEMMFITSEASLDRWEKETSVWLQELNPTKRRWLLSYSEERRAILKYIYELYAKWRPYDDLEWLTKY